MIRHPQPEQMPTSAERLEVEERALIFSPPTIRARVERFREASAEFDFAVRDYGYEHRIGPAAEANIKRMRELRDELLALQEKIRSAVRTDLSIEKNW
jgi:hypothetical protein